MATRKVKDAKDLTTDELIYFKGHAQATYMSDGRTVEDAIFQAATGGDDFINASSLVTGIEINGETKTPLNGVVYLGYVSKPLSTTTSSTMTLTPNVYHRNTNTSLSSLTITLGSITNNNVLNEYFVEFTTRSSGTNVSFPSTIKWPNGEKPTFEAGATYQVSIVNNLGAAVKFM